MNASTVSAAENAKHTCGTLLTTLAGLGSIGRWPWQPSWTRRLPPRRPPAT
jgi:hypothetical protein